MQDNLERLSDERLARLVADGDPLRKEAFELLCRRGNLPRRAQHFARSRGAKPPDDEDLAFRTIFKLWHALKTRRFDCQQPVEPWLFQVLRRDIASYHRRPERRLASLSSADGPPGEGEVAEPVDHAPGVEDQLIRQEEIREVLDCLDSSLPPDVAKAFRWRHLEYWTPKEIARELGCDVLKVYRMLETAKRVVESKLRRSKVNKTGCRKARATSDQR